MRYHHSTTNFLIVLSSALLSACAAMSEQQCISADWERIGETDGDLGRTPDHVERYIEACAKYGIDPDLAAYAEGHAGGLDDYCSIPGGVKAGSRGAGYQDVCQPGFAEDFLIGYRAGRRIYEAEKEAETLENTLRKYAYEASTLDQNSQQRRLLSTEIAILRTRLLTAESEIRRAQRDAQDLISGR